MTPTPYRSALIAGAGPGLGASLARVFSRDGGMQVLMAARQPERLQAACDEIGAHALRCDATDPADVAALFDQASQHFGAAPEVVVYNASRRVRGRFVDIDPAAMSNSVAVTAMGAFHVAQQAARPMLSRGKGAILFTGATAGVKGFAQSASFAMGKFALRGLAQSLARELGPHGIHVGHVIVDGLIRSSASPGAESAAEADTQLDPEAIAQTYLHLLSQHRSAWTWEVDVRPWSERF
ncbi:MAG: SDR family NAD(P)-dependent oxidoreductase [Pseudomonadota bacterium]|nr:SDR family NAD(P)-dependent oxidoreductase [Pseudomonadota bacterium]